MNNSTLHTFPLQRQHPSAIYLLIISVIAVALSALPFIATNISTRASGITRPATERTEIRPVLTGIVDKVLYKEGQAVQEGAVIAVIRDDVSSAQEASNQYDINQRQQFVHDLKMLTSPSFGEGRGRLCKAPYTGNSSTAFNTSWPIIRLRLKKYSMK